MSVQLLFIVSLLYAYTAGEQAYKGNIPGCIIWLNYACANLALIWYTK